MARIDRLEVQARKLVKFASVIGRSFFYRVLSEVADTVQNVDDRLSYLKEMELFEVRMRLEEQEYLFKHALAQEAAYDSILPRKRKELHLKVVESIEKVFNEKLHEFYGMLAYHCSRGENLGKAEHYLIKAGEEALKSSASNEALHYYREALSLYLNNNPDDTDHEKVAMLEKNIALALYNKGQYEEAENSLEQVRKILREVNVVPWQISGFYMGQFEYDLYQLAQSTGKGDDEGLNNHRKNAAKSGRLLLKASRKVAQIRTGSYKLMGVYNWLIDDRKKALNWWQKAIEEGERLGARVELAGTYFEIGKHLGESGSKYNSLDGVSAHDYLEKARVLFEEMNFQPDLAELLKVMRE